MLLLDEPLRALEAQERARLLRLPGRRRTVVLASRYPASEAGLVSHVALLRGGRVALMAPVGDLEAAGLPLSMRGIAALAIVRAASEGGRGGSGGRGGREPGGIVTRLAVRELWITFRLLLVLVASVGAGAVVALLPARCR